MVGYKLSKNDWVTPFFVIFRSVREILLVTVFLEHPVAFRLEPRHGPPPWYFPKSRPHGPHHADGNSQWIDVPCRWVFFLLL